MLPNDRAQPAAPDKPSWGARVLHAYRQYPLWLKVVIAIAASIVLSMITYRVIEQPAITLGRKVSARLSPGRAVRAPADVPAP